MQIEGEAGNLEFEIYGRTGPRIMLVMGLGMRGNAWERQLDDLSQDHQVLIFDHRGIGHSAPSKRHYTLKCLAADALRILDHLDWQDVHLGGVSMGGMIAQEIVLNQPARFRSLSLIATNAGGIQNLIPPRQLLTTALKGALNKGRRPGHEILYSRSFLNRTPKGHLDARMLRSTAPRARRAPLQQLIAVLGHDTRDRLSELSLPTLIISPNEDALIRQDACQKLLQYLPHAQLVEIEGAGHGVVYEAADAVNAAIRSHIARAGGTRSGEAQASGARSDGPRAS